MSSRIADCFATLKEQNKTALISFTMAGDPDLAASEELLMALPDAGVDIIELGMPFSDPTADGPSIAAAGLRALQSNTTLQDVLDMAKRFRTTHPDTPLIFMGYYNPIMQYGGEAFAKAAHASGVDGLIIVDLPPEEEDELLPALNTHDVALVRLIAPTTPESRIKKLLSTAKGFVYTIAIKGITGAASANADTLGERVSSIKAHSDLPIVVGFGIKTPEQAAELKGKADGVVVGSAIVDTFHTQGKDAAIALTKQLSEALN